MRISTHALSTFWTTRCGLRWSLLMVGETCTPCGTHHWPGEPRPYRPDWYALTMDGVMGGFGSKAQAEWYLVSNHLDGRRYPVFKRVGSGCYQYYPPETSTRRGDSVFLIRRDRLRAAGYTEADFLCETCGRPLAIWPGSVTCPYRHDEVPA